MHAFTTPGRILSKRGWSAATLWGLLGLAVILATACDDSKPPPPLAPPPMRELVYYDWADDMPQAVFDAFTAEYGIKVKYVTYASGEEAVANLRAGKVYDVVAVETQDIPALIADGLLAKINYRNVPNFKNISANFRDLSFDPGNTYTIPFNWGTTGLLVRSDLVEKPVTRWADLWDERFAGKLIVWSLQRYLLGITLKSLGYSVNSENPEQLAAALERLEQIKSRARIMDYDTQVLDDMLASGEVVILYGFSGDLERLHKKNSAVHYVLPEEGSVLWGDHFAIPAKSSDQHAAELLINFLLRPEIIALFVNEIHYAAPNDAATPFIEPEIRNDPAIFPSNDLLKAAEILLPLGPKGQKLYDETWSRFLAGGR